MKYPISNIRITAQKEFIAIWYISLKIIPKNKHCTKEYYASVSILIHYLLQISASSYATMAPVVYKPKNFRYKIARK